MKRKVESTEPATGGKPRYGIASNVVTENAASVPKLFAKLLDGLHCGSNCFFPTTLCWVLGFVSVSRASSSAASHSAASNHLSHTTLSQTTLSHPISHTLLIFCGFGNVNDDVLVHAWPESWVHHP